MKKRIKKHFQKQKSVYAAFGLYVLGLVFVVLILLDSSDLTIAYKRGSFSFEESPMAFLSAIIYQFIVPFAFFTLAYFYLSSNFVNHARDTRLYRIYLSRALTRYRNKNYDDALIYFEKAAKIQKLDVSNARLSETCKVKSVAHNKLL